MWRDWFTFSRQDRRAILLLSVLIVIAGGLFWTKPWWRDKEMSSESLENYKDSFLTQEPIVEVKPRPFNPNTADSLELLSVGLTPRVARNILRYREAGGRFRKPEDLARIYGLHDTLYAQVEPYITIPSENKVKRTASERSDRPMTSAQDTVRKEHPYAAYMRAKYKPGQYADLNVADTTELVKIPGVGPVYARMIVDYRERLGGFHSAAQVYDLDVLPEGVADWMRVDTPSVVKLKVNRLSVTQLRTHPYLTFYQAKAIVALRKREGDIKSVRQLLFLDEFSEADIERLEPYLSFDP